MSHLVVAPDLLAAAAAEVAHINSALQAADGAAAAHTAGVPAAGADEVPAVVPSGHALNYQALSATPDES